MLGRTIISFLPARRILRVYLWDDRPGSAKAAKGWFILTGEQAPSRIYVPRGVVHAYRNIGSTCRASS